MLRLWQIGEELYQIYQETAITSLRNRVILSGLEKHLFRIKSCCSRPFCLVEDDAFQRKAAETYLINHDLKVIAVENGAQMRRQISRAMPDLVLLDVQLPGPEDGFALARWLRESNTRVGIIMLTAAGDPVDKVLGLESGADDYVAKPYEPRELLARCKSVLRRSANKATPAAAGARAHGPPHARPAQAPAARRRAAATSP